MKKSAAPAAQSSKAFPETKVGMTVHSGIDSATHYIAAVSLMYIFRNGAFAV